GGWDYQFKLEANNQEKRTKTRIVGRESTGKTKTVTTKSKNKYTGQVKTGEKKVDIKTGGKKETTVVDNPYFGTHRNDISFGGWCAQALKAAKIADLKNEGLDAAIEKAIPALDANCSGAGIFAYATHLHPGTAKGQEIPDVEKAGKGKGGGVKRKSGGLTGVGVLCLQLLGAGNSNSARLGMNWLDQNATFVWGDEAMGNSPVYFWYYITQAKFHAGGGSWSEWNTKFAPELVKTQNVVPKAIRGPSGRMVDIGYWNPPKEFVTCKNRVYTTTLCTLMLEVYYRYLPTYQKIDDLDFEMGAESGAGEEKNKSEDIEIVIENI
ncbi:hypothetical protein ACFLS1_12350, partial [Verrucomicrobiota bacterium]